MECFAHFHLNLHNKHISADRTYLQARRAHQPARLAFELNFGNSNLFFSPQVSCEPFTRCDLDSMMRWTWTWKLYLVKLDLDKRTAHTHAHRTLVEEQTN